MAVSPETKQNFLQMAGYLQTLGLGELFTVDSGGNPGGWLWQQIRSGIDTAEELRAAIEQTDVWRDRYSVIVEQRKRSAAGQPTQVMEVAEVMEYKSRAAQIMRQYGVPGWFYDQWHDLDDMILNGLSVVELEERLAGAWSVVRDMDPNITQQFRDFYGVGEGDGALVAYFLDPAKTQAQLDKVAMAAYAGGIARNFNLQLDRDQAEMFSLFDKTRAGVAQDMTEINAQSGLLQEGAGEADDLSEREGFDAIVLGDPDARRRLEGRVLRRQANARAGGGGALATQEGLTGVSRAR